MRKASMGMAEGPTPTTAVPDWRAADFGASLAGRSGHTRDAYEHDVAEFVAWAERGGCSDPRALDHRTLRRYLAYLDTRGFARASIARKAAALRAYLRFLKRHGVIDRDPGVSLRAPKGGGRLPRVIRSEEAVDLLDAASDAAHAADDPGGGEPDDDPVAVAVVLRDLAVLEVLYGAGLRVAECCGLRRADCDLERGLVTVLGKGSKVRRVPLGVPAVDALAGWLSHGRPALESTTSPPDAVFLNRRGRILSPRDARRILERYPLPDGRGAPRTRRPRHHPDLHPRDPRSAPSRLRSDPPPCLTTPTKRSTSSGSTTRRRARRTRANASSSTIRRS
jgi:integrase/recombinase XerC